MIIFLYGQDNYRIKQNLGKILAEYQKKNPSGLGLLELDFDDPLIGLAEQLRKLEDGVKTASFFNEKRLIVVKNPFCQATVIKRLLNEQDLVFSKDKIIVFIETALPAELAKKDQEFFKILTTKPALSKLFEPLTGKKLDNWIEKGARDLGLAFAPKAVKKLTHLAGNNSWQLACEIAKIANYLWAQKSGPQNQVITEEDIEVLISPKIDLNIFQTIDALGNKEKARAIFLLNRHLETDDDPYYLFSMIVYQFRNLLRVKSLLARYPTQQAIAKKTGLHPFVVRKIIEQSRKFELAELKQKFTQLAQSDIAIKQGRVDITDCLFQIALT